MFQKKGMLFYKRSITLLLDYTYLELDKFLHDLSLEKILNYKRYIYMIIIIFTNVCPLANCVVCRNLTTGFLHVHMVFVTWNVNVQYKT